jgi:hypothetical protein
MFLLYYTQTKTHKNDYNNNMKIYFKCMKNTVFTFTYETYEKYNFEKIQNQSF